MGLMLVVDKILFEKLTYNCMFLMIKYNSIVFKDLYEIYVPGIHKNYVRKYVKQHFNYNVAIRDPNKIYC